MALQVLSSWGVGYSSYIAHLFRLFLDFQKDSCILLILLLIVELYNVNNNNNVCIDSIRKHKFEE